MNQPLQKETGPSVSEMVKEISSQAVKCLRLEVDLFRAQMRDEVRQRRRTAMIVGIGLSMGAVGLLISAAAMIDLLEATTSYPLWLCEALAASVFLLIGALIAARGSSEKGEFKNKRPSTNARHSDNVTEFPDSTLRYK